MTFDFSEVAIFPDQSSDIQTGITNTQNTQTSRTTLSSSHHSEELLTFALVDAISDKTIATFDQLSSAPIGQFDGQDLSRFSIVGVINQDHSAADSIQSIKFESNYGTKIDNIAPFAMFGDREGDLWGRAVEEGTYQVKATAYSERRGQGRIVDTATLKYTVTEAQGEGNHGTQTSDFFKIGLIDAKRDRLIPGFENLESGRTINLNDLGTDSYNFVATINQSYAQASKVKSIKFESQYGDKVENVVPFALFGDNGKGDFSGKSVKAGPFSFKATAFDGRSSTGKALQSMKFDYTFVNGHSNPDPQPIPLPAPLPAPTPKIPPEEKPGTTLPAIIYDTDISADADDAGALGVLHTLADQGKATINAIVVNGRNADNKAAQAIDAINTYFGRPDIPIGTENAGHISKSRYTKHIANEFPNDSPLDTQAPKAFNIYRNTLRAAKDKSITIVSVGLLSNLQKLLQEDPSLVRQKVKKLVVMGGRYGGAVNKPEFNFELAPRATKYVLDYWPTEIIFSGAEIGLSIIAGTGLQAAKNHPIARAYELHRAFGGQPAIEVGKASFDHTAVMLGVLGVQNNWNLVSGTNTFNLSTRQNTFKPGSGKHKYITQKRDPVLIARDIDRWMVGV